MPRSLWNPDARHALIARVNSLEPRAPAIWGKMTAPEMLAHVAGWMAMAKGDLRIEPRNLILRFTPLKQLLVYVLPIPRGVPTAKELIGRPMLDWADECASICRDIDSFESFHPDGAWPDHPAFGRLTPRAWGVLGYRHTDHHLRQFGV